MKYQNTAYLGPKGTNTELALKKSNKTINSTACVSISAVFDAVLSGQVDSGFIPIENMIQGPVTETLDSLLECHGQIVISDSFTMPITHALGVSQEFWAHIKDDYSKIKTVYSKDQAIQQCSKYLRQHLPKAEFVYVESTVKAIETVTLQRLNAAVIAPEEALLGNNFQIIQKNIADTSFNKTRFVFITQGNIKQKELTWKEEYARLDTAKVDYVTSIAIDPRKDRQGILHDMLDVISSKHKVNMLSIHSRPNSTGGFVFYLDLEGHLGSVAIGNCIEDLRSYCSSITGGTAEIAVFGCYEREAFKSSLFKSIGIVGGAGIMGQWFNSFFTSAGYLIHIKDKNTNISWTDFCSQCDVIILSVPMSEIGNIATEIAPYLQPGQLIVENCSIKNSSLPILSGILPSSVELLGIHTMFGGDIESLRGENVIITKTTSSAQAAQEFADVIYKYGAKITEASIDTHDHAVSYTQSMAQLIAIILAELMADNFPDVASIKTFNTRNSRQIFSVVKRVLNQNDELITALQLLNKKSNGIRNDFLQIANKIISNLNSGSKHELLESVKKSRKFLGNELTDKKD